LLLVAAYLLAPQAWAQAPSAHAVSAATQSLLLSDRALFLVDASAALTVTEVAALAQSGGMKPVANPRIPMLRIDRGEAFWLQVEADIAPGAPREWMVELEKAVLSRVQLFTKTPAGWDASAQVGAQVPFSARPVNHRHYVFPVTLEPGRRATFLVRVVASGPATPKVTLWQPAPLADSSLGVSLFLCLYFGLAGGMVLFNFLLWISVKDRGYLLYVGCVVCTSTAFAAQSGLASQYAWGEWPWWNSHAMYFGFAGALPFSTLLTRDFLKTRERLPLADKSLLAIAWMGGAVAVAVSVIPGNIATLIQVPLALASAVAVTGAAMVGARRGWPGAKYFFAAWASLYVGVMVMLGRVFHVLPDNVVTINALAIASAFEMVLLSLALADRINDEKRQREQAQSFAVGILEASQALGAETRLEGLHARVCDIMVGLTGASRVQFVLWDADLPGWFLLQPREPGRRLAVEEAARRGLLDLASLEQAQQARQVLHAPDGSLVLPILHHGVPNAILLLEGAGGKIDFTPDARGIVEGIAGPLAVSLENVLLYERLEQHVAERTRQLRDTQQELVRTARRAGMAEIATNVLHNVGNTLNSINVAAELMRTRLAQSRSASLSRAVDLLDAHQGSLGTFFTEDEKGRVFPRYLRELDAALQRERQELATHLDHLAASIDHVKKVVATQQTYAGPSLIVESVVPAELVEDALRISLSSRQGASTVQVVRQMADTGPVLLDRTRVLQVLINLLDNAYQAMTESGTQAPVLTLQTLTDADRLVFVVRDTGCGIAPENLTRIFSHGFTTRAQGHGFGLHGCALAAGEMGGRLTAHSAGPAQGAAFTLDLPLLAA
jgi:C4-dicarboxylate-specific signal transduction histidine kinase